MKISHLSHSNNVEDGGISIAVKNLISSQSDINPNWICSSNYSSFLRDYLVAKEIKKYNPSIIQVHGLWRSPTRALKFYLKNKYPYIITPHGMLDPWALRQSSLKKKIVYSICEKDIIAKANCIQALCKNEIDAIRNIHKKVPIALIPNGVNLPSEMPKNVIPPPWLKDFDNSKKVLLFFGRFHRKKGIYPLLAAWKIFVERNANTDWRLVFVGLGDSIKIRKIINREELKYCYMYGPSFGDTKDSIFRNSDAFILPSYSEGLPITAIEAMSYKLPCLLTSECNISDAFDNGSELIEVEVDKLSFALDKFCKKSDEEYNYMGSQAYDFVNENFTWDIIQRKFFQLYGWILKQQTKPTFIY